MDISTADLEKLFTFHRDGYYGRWNFGLDPDTKWPISIDITIDGGWNKPDEALVKFTEKVGPETRRTVSIPLRYIFETWPIIHTLIVRSEMAP